MPNVKIAVRPNGPYKITGPVEIVDAAGVVIPTDPNDEAIFLCRCGESAEKPFCDGMHKTCSFTPDGANPF